MDFSGSEINVAPRLIEYFAISNSETPITTCTLASLDQKMYDS